NPASFEQFEIERHLDHVVGQRLVEILEWCCPERVSPAARTLTCPAVWLSTPSRYIMRRAAAILNRMSSTSIGLPFSTAAPLSQVRHHFFREAAHTVEHV